MRFSYASTNTRPEAEIVLDDMFANGEICEAEHPQIKQVHKHYPDGTCRTFYHIEIDG